MICEGVISGPTAQVQGYEGVHGYEGTCTLKSTWIMEIQFEGSKDPVIIHCCTQHKLRSQANESHIIGALRDFGIEATIVYRGIQ